MFRQRTIRNTIAASGIGVHTGKVFNLTLHPGEPNTGLRIRRTDLSHPVEIPLRTEFVTDTSLSTAVGRGGVEVSTVEHLMSALWGLGIDNAIAEIDGEEIPIMDGSASPFVFMLQSAGIVEQAEPRQFIRIRRAVEFRDEHSDAWVRLEPYRGMKVNFTMIYDHPAMADWRDEYSINFGESCYVKQISRARTFGFVRDMENMHANNKALGASMRNAIALDERGILNEGGLRQNDEFVCHKILDALGDLYMAGNPMLGHFTGYKSGHRMNHHLLEEVMADEQNWELVSFASIEEAASEAGNLVWQPPSSIPAHSF